MLTEALLNAGHALEPSSEMHCWAIDIGTEAATMARTREEDLFMLGRIGRREVFLGQ